MQIPPITPLERAIGRWIALFSAVPLDTVRKLSQVMDARTAHEIARGAELLSKAADALAEAARLRLEELRSHD